MKKLIVSSASALALMVGLSAEVDAQETDYRYKYIVKFVCGFVPEESQALIGGEYRTAINIYNAHETRSSGWEWDAQATHGGEGDGSADEFEPGGAFEIDCDLLAPWYDAGWAKGFVYILSRWPLEVVAVYTAGTSGADTGTGVSSIDVEHVKGYQLSRQDNPIYPN